MKKAYEVALSSSLALFFVGLYGFLGFPIEALPYYAAVSVVALYALSKHNIWLGRKEFSENVSKPIILDVEGTHIYQEVEFRLKYVSELMINVSGAVIPLLMALFISYRLVISGMVTLNTMILLTAFLTIAYNRITLFIKGRGLGVPMATGITLTVGTLLSLYFTGVTDSVTAPLLAFGAGVPAAILGVDVMNLRNAALFRSRYVIIGGMGPADAVIMLPVMSCLLIRGIVAVI